MSPTLKKEKWEAPWPHGQRARLRPGSSGSGPSPDPVVLLRQGT